ncbi:SET domain-containing protein-lysine N-methyltransferase [Streptomyces capitiformicae]|uniref:SET domain-containing protein n=1 Tax=Streptomyces capitiformicae TaxID=2014920 RepID=A0A918ZR75_9ACTN|nr:SET domain-containing protein-lysine N-methyltransferase [Streptomyces capitiformicae]GHE64271.1 hypothetical protein GCM10017771_87670 [Streptomyces capitiformicae]
MNGLEIRDTAHGRGVFATCAFRVGDVVERCPVVLVPPAELVFVPHVRALAYSWFHWVQPHWEKGGGAICLGYGALYNSCDEPNLSWDSAADEERVIVFTALRDIEPGEELTYKYAWPDWVARTGFGPIDADGLPLQVPRRSQVAMNNSSAAFATTHLVP